MTHQQFLNAVDMLKGSINRMCVTDDLDELLVQYHYVQERIDWLFSFRESVLKKD